MLVWDLPSAYLPHEHCATGLLRGYTGIQEKLLRELILNPILLSPTACTTASISSRTNLQRFSIEPRYSSVRLLVTSCVCLGIRVRHEPRLCRSPRYVQRCVYFEHKWKRISLIPSSCDEGVILEWLTFNSPHSIEERRTSVRGGGHRDKWDLQPPSRLGSPAPTVA